MVLVLKFISRVSTRFLQRHVVHRVKVNNYYILQTRGHALTPVKRGDIFQRMAYLRLVGDGSFCLWRRKIMALLTVDDSVVLINPACLGVCILSYFAPKCPTVNIKH